MILELCLEGEKRRVRHPTRIQYTALVAPGLADDALNAELTRQFTDRYGAVYRSHTTKRGEDISLGEVLIFGELRVTKVSGSVVLEREPLRIQEYARQTMIL